MLTDTITTIENQFFDGLKAVQEPTIEAVRTASELLGQLPFADRSADLLAKLPSTQELVTRNFTFAQRLLDAQRDFAVELAAITAPPAKAPTAKKSAA